MPQMNKGGKFIFGKSLIRDDSTIHLPPQALAEYNAAELQNRRGRIYQIQREVILLDKHFREWRHSAESANVRLSQSKDWNGTYVYPKQRHCFYYGRNGSFIGKS